MNKSKINVFIVLKFKYFHSNFDKKGLILNNVEFHINSHHSFPSPTFIKVEGKSF